MNFWINDFSYKLKLFLYFNFFQKLFLFNFLIITYLFNINYLIINSLVHVRIEKSKNTKQINF